MHALEKVSVAIVSGYFNPLHVGHLQLFEEAKENAEWLVVLVNNDAQQLVKKGKIIVPSWDRIRIVKALRCVDDVRLVRDTDSTVAKSIRWVHEDFPGASMVFCNGGDRSSPDAVPTAEEQVCDELGIMMLYGIGGSDKLDSSSRINEALSQ